MEQTEDIIAAATEARLKWARAEARQVWKKHGNGKIPVMPEEIIQELGIPLREDDLTMDGVSYMDSKGLMFIMYKRNSPPNRKRFTLAHELGHIALEHISLNQSSQNSTKAQEQEAHAFANSLLVPVDDLKPFMKQAFRTLEQIEDRYQVSREVALIAVQSNRLFPRLRATAAALHII